MGSELTKGVFQLHPPWFLLEGAARVDVQDLFWNLEKTIEQNPEKWGWSNSPCGVCGAMPSVRFVLPPVPWTEAMGYRCELHVQ